MSSEEQERWIGITEAVQMIRRTDRRIRDYAKAGRIRMRKRNGRVEYHAGDAEQLAAELLADRAHHLPIVIEVEPEEQQRQRHEITARLNDAEQRRVIAETALQTLRQQLEERLSPEQERSLRNQLALAQAELARSEAEARAAQASVLFSQRLVLILGVGLLVLLGIVLVVLV